MLELSIKLFKSMNNCDIKYSHWKSNIHLDRSLEGKTDLDLLVHPDCEYSFNEILTSLNIKKIISPPEKQFVGLEDWLGFDDETGRFIHLHVHYKLILGQRFIKNHHLPLENLILENFVFKNNVKIPCPEIELLLLIVRAHMKVDLISLLKHLIKDTLGQTYTAFPFAIEKEFNELIKNSDRNRIKKFLIESQLPISSDKIFSFIDKISSSKLRSKDIYCFQMYILNSLKTFKRKSGFLVSLTYVYFIVRQSTFAQKVLKPTKKTFENHGIVVAIVGADGSGKSTLTTALRKWLSWKLEAPLYYYGIPKTINVGIFSFVIRIFKKANLNAAVSFVECCLWTYVARQRAIISTRSGKDARSGKVVITDRFPMDEFRTMEEPMDGPRIRKCVDIKSQWLMRKEESYYDNVQLPDRVYVLQVAFDELRSRKTDLDLHTHSLKAEAVNSLEEHGPMKLIDGNRAYNDVELELKRLIWGVL